MTLRGATALVGVALDAAGLTLDDVDGICSAGFPTREAGL